MNALPDALAKSFRESPPSINEALAFEAMAGVSSKCGWLGLFGETMPVSWRNEAFVDLIHRAVLGIGESDGLLVLKRLYNTTNQLLELGHKEIARVMAEFQPDKIPKLTLLLNPSPWALLQMACYRWNWSGVSEPLFLTSQTCLETVKSCALGPRPREFYAEFVGDMICALHNTKLYSDKGSLVEWLCANGVGPDVLMSHANSHNCQRASGCEFADAVVALSSFGFLPYPCLVPEYKQYQIHETDDERLATCSSNIKLVAQFQECVAKRVNEAIKNPSIGNLVVQFVFCRV